MVTRRGAPVAVMTPQKRQFWVQHQVTSETAIILNHGNNLLLALGDDLGAGRWSVRVQIRPLVSPGVAGRSDHGDRRVRWLPPTAATEAPRRWQLAAGTALAEKA